MKLYPVPESKLSVTDAIIEARLSEAATPKRLTLRRCLETVRTGYTNRTVAAYVDDMANPQHILVMAHMPSTKMEGITALVMLIYSREEARGDAAAIKAFKTAIENYATHHGACAIMGSSWTYGGSQGIDSLWKAWGYEQQEIAYIKEI